MKKTDESVTEETMSSLTDWFDDASSESSLEEIDLLEGFEEDEKEFETSLESSIYFDHADFFHEEDGLTKQKGSTCLGRAMNSFS